MTIKVKGELEFGRVKYFGAEQIGFTEEGSFVVDLFTTPPPKPCGGYFTVIPISPAEYRRENPTKAAVRDDGNSIVLISDCGAEYRITMDRASIDRLLTECEANGLPLLETGISPEGPQR